jgi:hypothetical protein
LCAAFEALGGPLTWDELTQLLGSDQYRPALVQQARLLLGGDGAAAGQVMQASSQADTGKAGRRAFSRTAPVTQRHIVDRHHLEADLRFSVGWTGLLEVYGSLVRFLPRQHPAAARPHIMPELPHDMRQNSKFST